MILRNISVNKLFTRSGDEIEYYFSVLKYMKPKDIIIAYPREHRDPYQAIRLQELTFGEVAKIKKKINSLDGMFYVFEKVFGISDEKLLAVPVKSFFPALNWIRDELERLIQIESDYIKSDYVDSNMIAAGINKLDKFREWNTLKALAKDYGMLPEEVEERKYKFVFTDMYHGAVSDNVNHKYMEIMKTKK